MRLPGPPVSTWGPMWCQLQAAGNWFSQLSTWLWTMAYAHAVHAGVDRPGLARRSSECYYHVVCWGVPLVVVGTGLALGGVFGHADDGSSLCTICRSDVSMGFYSVLWLALAYNAYIFFRVHRTMRSVLTANAAVLDPTATREMSQRLDALGNRFLLYLLTFLASQVPCALRHVLVVVFGSPVEWASPLFWGGLSLVADLLCPLHGFLNGMVYGVAARGICKGEDSCCGVCCGGRRYSLWNRLVHKWRFRHGGSFRSTFRTSRTDDVDDHRNTTPLMGSSVGSSQEAHMDQRGAASAPLALRGFVRSSDAEDGPHDETV
jgi:hypothetical protein